jgi:tRNA-dihydrouridine synthase
MIGRAALGRPWIFRDIEKYFENGAIAGSEPPLSLEERLEIMRGHISLAVELKGERVAVREFRKHAAWYIKGIRGAAALRNKCMSIDTLSDFDKLVSSVMG